MKVLLISNSSGGMYVFRREVIEAICKRADTYLCAPDDANEQYWESIGCSLIKFDFQRHGTNPLKELRQIRYYKKLIAQINPDICLTYTIKPNIYGGIACSRKHVPYIANVTGLGDALENGGIMRKVLLGLYKMGLKRACCVFFQNETNRQLFLTKRIVNGKTRRIPGSGVNLQTHCYEPYPKDDGTFRFLFVARINRDKGIEELLKAIDTLKADNYNCIVSVVGACEGDYIEKLREAEAKGNIKYYGPQTDVHSFYKDCHCVVLPSYHEGTSNVLLEGSSTGRPIIATRVPGCQEVFDEGTTGFGCEPRNSDSLRAAMLKMMAQPREKRETMGKAARKKMELEYDRNIVINAYLEEMEQALTRNTHEL